MSNPDNGSTAHAQDTSNTRWQFIDSSSNSRSNLTQVKRHVMQEYMRQKKGGPRQSESEEEIPRPLRRRGRPKKTAGVTRKSRSKSMRRDVQTVPESPKISTESQPLEGNMPDEVELAHKLPVNDTFLGTQGPNTTSALPFQEPDSQTETFRFPSSCVDTPLDNQYNPSDFDTLASWSSVPNTSLDREQSPRTILSAARTDPFNSLPLELDQDGQRLFDFYVNDMPACSYGTHFRSPKAHNWYTSVFVREAMKGDVAFQNTILVHAANTWAWVRNEMETLDTLLHRDRAVTMLRDHLYNNPQDNSDVAIVSCLSAAALEDFDPRPGHKEISWIHMRAARDMIRARGGPAAFANTRLGMLINWQDYILSGYETHGPSFFFENLPAVSTAPARPTQFQPPPAISSIPSPPSSTSSSSAPSSPCIEPRSNTIQPSLTYPMDEIRLQCEEFLNLLRRCEQLSLFQRSNPTSCDLSRHTAVQETSLLYQILASSPGARFTSSGDRKQMVARLTALIMLNAALWDYRYTPLYAGNFLRTLEQAIIGSEVSMSGSVEAVLQILLACNDGYTSNWTTGNEDLFSSAASQFTPDFTQYSSTALSPSARPWFAGRMLKIAKRLGADSWYRVSGFLFSCLALQVSEPSVYLWEADLRQEILDAPLTSYVMPSLM